MRRVGENKYEELEEEEKKGMGDVRGTGREGEGRKSRRRNRGEKDRRMVHRIF